MKRVYEVGDSMMNYAVNPRDNLPVFSEGAFINFYPEAFATEIRTPTGERSTRQAVFLMKFSWEQACKLFEDYDFKNKATIGNIPNFDDWNSDEYTAEQKTVMDEREVQVAI